MKLQRYEKELAGLKDRVKLLEELIEKEKGIKNDGYPKVGEIYYYVAMGDAGKVVQVGLEAWSDCESDLYYWNFCHGSTDENKVKWNIKHIELVNEIKKYTRPFLDGAQNWYFEVSVASYSLIRDFCTEYFRANEYGYFDNQGGIVKVIEQFGEEYILKFLFEPTDGDYKAVMDWLAEQEEL